MEREILFRGKRVDNWEWVKGYYCVGFETTEYPIIKTFNGFHHKVIPDTVGQFTGLTDKNGVKIFAGDIVRASNIANSAVGIIRFGKYGIVFGDKKTHLGFYLDWNGTERGMLRSDLVYWATMCEVISNIHDNPELLEGSDEKCQMTNTE